MTHTEDGAVAVATPDEAGAPAPAASESAGRRAERWALIAFLVVAVVSVPLLLRLGHDRWFQFDDWDFLASRDAGNLRDLLEPHGAHWSTLPILAYRAEWYLFGLHSYWPYQLVSVLSHLTVVLLVRTVIRRAGVRPWTATAAVLPLVFFGAGEENITWGFQINFTLSLAFGLAQLLLADHDGPVDRRDWLALLAGLAALMSSGIGVTMVAVVGLAMLVRRGWRAAALQTLPLGVAYLLWYVAIARDGYGQELSDPLDALGFARTTLAAGFGGLAQVPGLGWVLACLIAGGLFLAWRGRPFGEVRKEAAAPVAMAAGAFFFVVITASGRVGFAPGIERATRYVHVVAVLLLPVVAVAADAVMRRWRAAVPVLVAFLVASVVGNVHDFSNERAYGGEFLAAYRTSLLAIPRVVAGRAGAARPATRAQPGTVRVGRLAAGWCEVRPHSRPGRPRAGGAGGDRGAGGPAGEPPPSAGPLRDGHPRHRGHTAPGQLPPPARRGPVVGRVHRCDGGRRAGPVPVEECPHRRLRRIDGERVVGSPGPAGRAVRPRWRSGHRGVGPLMPASVRG